MVAHGGSDPSPWEAEACRSFSHWLWKVTFSVLAAAAWPWLVEGRCYFAYHIAQFYSVYLVWHWPSEEFPTSTVQTETPKREREHIAQTSDSRLGHQTVAGERAKGNGVACRGRRLKGHQS